MKTVTAAVEKFVFLMAPKVFYPDFQGKELFRGQAEKVYAFGMEGRTKKAIDNLYCVTYSMCHTLWRTVSQAVLKSSRT